MELQFEYIDSIGSQGSYPDFLQYYDTEGQVFYIKSGEMYAKATEKLEGEFDSPVWLDELKVAPDTGMSLLEIKTLNGFGLVGSYLTPTAQKMIIYEFQFDMDRYLNSGSIKHSINNPISSFSLTLENPINEASDTQENAVMGEKSSLLSPGAKVMFGFTVGENEDYYELGTFYIDRSDYSLLRNTANVDGRNLTGKALKDQTLNQHSNINWNTLTAIFEDLFEYANLAREQYEIETSTDYRYYNFEPTKDILSALNEILKSLVNWRMEETPQGQIIVGSPTFNKFTPRGNYTFERNKDIFSRQIKMDDQESYRKVCVHDKDKTIMIYKDVVSYTGWNLQSNKTLFVEVPQGSSAANATDIANELATRLANVGKVETFTGPIRPHIIVGDQARIVDEDGTTTLGLITEVTHNFGKSGFTTEFTVDSGGRLGRGRLTDYIRMARGEISAGQIGYEEIIEEPV